MEDEIKFTVSAAKYDFNNDFLWMALLSGWEGDSTSMMSCLLIGCPTQNMSIFHIPTYPPSFFQPSGITHNIISCKFQQNKLSGTMPFLRLKSEKSYMGYPKYFNFSYSILSYQFFPTIWNNSQYYILKVSTKHLV